MRSLTFCAALACLVAAIALGLDALRPAPVAVSAFDVRAVGLRR